MDSIVLSMRLSSGEEVIAEVKNAEYFFSAGKLQKDHIVVDRPHILHVIPDESTGALRKALSPMFNADPDIKGVTIEKMHIVATITAPSELAKGYLQQVSGIALIRP